LVSDFVYYQSKECEQLTKEELSEAIESGTVTIDEMVEEFRKALKSVYGND
jgi:dTDP-4-amino-4,6-dideoxygalactose transaminase